MTEEQLAEIQRQAKFIHPFGGGWDHVKALLAEVRRLTADNATLQAILGDATSESAMYEVGVRDGKVHLEKRIQEEKVAHMRGLLEDYGGENG